MNSYSKWQVYDYYGAKVKKVTRKNIRGFESELKQTKAYAINLFTGERIGYKKSEKEVEEMKIAELTEIGWGIWKDTEGNKWVATEEDELMNMETGEIEKIKEDYEMKKLEKWEIARGKELVEYIENSRTYDMCEGEVKELITLTGLEQEWGEKQDEFEEVLWKAMDIVRREQEDER